MRRILEIAAVCLLMGVAAGCSATRPTKYYALDTPLTPAAATEAIPVRLVVARVTSSNLYRDTRLVYGTGSGELGTYEYQRWAAPPADLIQDMLVASLRASGPYRSVSPVGSTARGDYVVRGHLDALDEIDKPALVARFTFRLELFDPTTGTTVWTGSYNHDEPVQGKQVSDVVEAMNRNVDKALQQLTGELRQYLAGHVSQQSAGQ